MDKKNKSMPNEFKIYTEPNNFLVIGKKGSGKTALGFKLLEDISLFRKAYVFRFPMPKLLKKLPFECENITSMKQLGNLTDGVCLIDEAHRYFDVLNKSVNEELKELLANSRQNNVSFVFVTHNSYFITRGIFSYIDARIIKEVNEGHWETDRPHMKKLYSKINIDKPGDYFIDSDYMRGKKKFELMNWYDKEFTTAYKNQNIKTDNPSERLKKFVEKSKLVRESAEESEKLREGAEESGKLRETSDESDIDNDVS